MEAVKTAALAALTLLATGYALWTAAYFVRGGKKKNSSAVSMLKRTPRRKVIGASRFVLPRRQSQPQAATSAKNEGGDEKANIFAEASVPEHPRQIPPEKLDEVFGTPPEGEANEPDEYSLPLYEDDYAAEEDEDEDDGPQPHGGRPRATGVSFERISEAYRAIAHDNPLTEEKRQETGRTLLELKRTDLFEAIVSARPDGNDRVSELIDSYMQAFYRSVSECAERKDTPPAPIPEGFDVRNFA